MDLEEKVHGESSRSMANPARREDQKVTHSDSIDRKISMSFRKIITSVTLRRAGL
jgi:hypothetical protein